MNPNERERIRWLKRRRRKHREFVRQFNFHESRNFLDLLHGDVSAKEARMACLYEYARESPSVWRAAKLRDERNQTRRFASKGLSPGQRIRAAADYAYEATKLLPAGPLAAVLLRFLRCASFPRKDWNELSTRDREALSIGEPERGAPFQTTDVWTLEALGVFDRFKELAKTAVPAVEDVPPGVKGRPARAVEPVIHGASSIYRVLFDIDFSQSEKHLAQAFKAWLRRPENRKRFARHKGVRRDAGIYLNKLKKLAAWRLYREFENRSEVANEFADANRKRVTQRFLYGLQKAEQRNRHEIGETRPFYDVRGKAANKQPLFREPADATKAESEAWAFLTRLLPVEFAAPDVQAFREIGGLGS